MRRTSALLIQMVVLGTAALAMAQDPAAPPVDPMAPPSDPMGAPLATSTDVTATAAPVAGGPLTKEGWSTKIYDRPIALSEGMLEIDVPFYASMSKDAVGKPVFVPLTIYYGVTDLFQLSLHHGTGLCITGTKNGCAKAYNDIGLRGTYSLIGRGGSFELAAWAQVDAVSISDPLKVRATVGPYLNWLPTSNLLVLSNPGLGIALNERDTSVKETLSIPLYLFLQVTDHIAPYLLTGLAATPFDTFADSFAIPAGVGVFYGVNNRIDVLAEFSMPAALGPEAVQTTDARTFLLQLNVRPL